MAFASEAIISVYNKVKPPYNISEAVQELVLEALDHVEDVNAMIRELVQQRLRLEQELLQVPIVQRIYPSDSNFLLVQVQDARAVYEWLLTQKIVVRDRSKVILCDNCLRITVGTELENAELLDALLQFQAE
jgi:histidinol-phosphate aminotransferase